MTTAQQVELYTRAVYDPRDVVEVRLLRPGEGRSLWFTAEKLASEADHLAALNAGGFNVYVGCNPRIADGRRGNRAVPLIRVIVADFDGVTVADALAKVRAAAMPPPTLTIDSGHGCHCYWRLAEPLSDPICFVEWQKDLAALLGSDPSIHNTERILRLPGFQNLKRAPVPCRVVECAAARTYDLADLPIPMRPGSDTPAPLFRVIIDTGNTDAGNRIDRCRAYLAKCPRAVAGSYGHTTTWHAANTCNRFGLTAAEAAAVMAWYSETMCDPPWSQQEIDHKIRDAYRRNLGQHGAKLREDRGRNPVFRVVRTKGVV
jgi:hypothetical protein